MRIPLLVLFFVVPGCGESQFVTTHDPHADAGRSSDAGLFVFDAGDGGGAGGGATTGGGSGGGAVTGGGSGGGAVTGGGSGGGVTGGGSGGGNVTGGGTGGGVTGGGGGSGTCSAPTCQGCCVAGACQPGTTAAACGQGGAACASCTLPDSCLTNRTCNIDPASSWIVQPTIAHIDPTIAWDATSAPDPEMALWCPSTVSSYNGLAAKVNNSYDPTWTTGGCTVTAAALFTGGFAFDCVDIDSISSDTITSFTTVPVTPATLRAGTLTGRAGGLDSVTFTFTKQ